MSPEQKINYIGGRVRCSHGSGARTATIRNVRRAVWRAQQRTISVDDIRDGIGLAASWDVDLAEKVDAGIGKDARARGIHFMLGPGVNIYRAPLNGCNFEYFGEEPFFTSSIAVRHINGRQSQGVSSAIKHFLANNSEYRSAQFRFCGP
jgi:beta-glucosidase